MRKAMLFCGAILLIFLKYSEGSGLFIASVTPTNKYVPVGGDVNITCTLKSSDFDAHKLSFQKKQGREWLPIATENIEKDLSIILPLKNVTLADAGNYFCFYDGSYSWLRSKIDVGSPPVGDLPIECDVNGLSMECDWTNPKHDGERYQLTWTLKYDVFRYDVNDEVHICNHYKTDTFGCIVERDQLVFGDLYTFTLISQNDYGTAKSYGTYTTEAVASVTPMQKILFFGDDVNITCTLKSSNYDAHKLSFQKKQGDKWQGVKWFPIATDNVIVTDLSITLPVTNVNLADRGIYFCFYDGVIANRLGSEVVILRFE